MLKADSKDLKQLLLIKYTGTMALLFAFVSSIYMTYLIFENIGVGLITGTIFTFVYVNFYLVLLSTVKKADFISYKNAIAEERTVTLNGVLLVGDGKKYPETFVESRYWGSLIFRLFFLGIFSAYLSLGGSLLFNNGLTDKLIDEHKQAMVKYYGDFIDKLYEKKIAEQDKRLSSLTLLSTKLQQQKDSINQFLQSDPLNAELQDELKWVTSDINDFNNSHQTEMIAIREALDAAALLVADKKARFNNEIQDKLFFAQRIKLLFTQNTFSSIFFFLIGLMIFFTPFILRYKMLRDQSYQMDDRLQEKVRKQIESDYEQLNLVIVEVIHQSGTIHQLKKMNLAKWPMKGDFYENPPFNTVKKLDHRTFLRKGSLVNFLIKRNNL